MTYEAPNDPLYDTVYEDFSDRRERLTAADLRHSSARNRITKFIADKIVKYHQRELYASEQHLGTIEATHALQAGEPPETVLQEFES
jgi:hypothetical protein